MNSIKVLIIGQLPTEVGGNYTTGMGKVVYELSKHKIPNIEICTFGTNIRSSNAERITSKDFKYAGYKLFPFDMLRNLFSHPINSYNEWIHYLRKCHINPIRCEFYKCNFQNIVSEFKPDIIHIHSIKQLAPLYFAVKDLRIPIILTFHGVFYKGDITDIVGRDLYKNNVPFINLATGLTKEMQKEIRNILGIEANKITIIPNGLNTDDFHYSSTARMELRRQHNISDIDIVFITVGSVCNRKGQLSFLKHLTNLKHHFHYWIIGKGDDLHEIYEFCKSHNIEDRIKIFGYVENHNLYKYYSASDIYVHASTVEGQALSEIEATATGLPIIVNKKIAGTVIGNINDLINYFVMDFDNPDYISLLEWTVKKRSERISKKIYDWSVIANMYSKLYESVNLKLGKIIR